MAVSLRFLGQAAAKQSFGLPTGATPRVLAKTPKTPKTPASALAFFEDCAQAARTPKTPARQAPPSFFGDVLSAGPRSAIASHASWTLPVPSCEGSPVGRSPTGPSPSASPAFRGGRRAGLKPQWADLLEANAGAKGAREAYLARRGRVGDRGSGAEPLPLGPGLDRPKGLLPTLLKNEARAAPAAESASVVDLPDIIITDTSAAATSARDAFLARRQRMASRSASSLDEPPAVIEATVAASVTAAGDDGRPVILGRGKAHASAAPAARPAAAAGPEGARDAFLARRRRIAARPTAAALAQAAAPAPTLLRREARAQAWVPQPQGAAVEADTAEASAAQALELFLARRQRSAARRAAFVV